jgi:SulP family sulfate permease
LGYLREFRFMDLRGIVTINGLRFDNLRGDIFGGLTAAVVALPLAMAFGVASGAGPLAGMYGAIFVGLFASLFGGTPSQISGPTGPMTVVMAGILTRYVAYDPVAGPAIAFTVVILGGFFQMLFGFFRLGRYISLVPHPVISGFMSGIGVIIILLQIGPLVGHAAPSRPLEAIRLLPSMLGNTDMKVLVLGLITLLIVFFLPTRLNRIVPAPLFALVAGTLAMLALFGRGSMSVIGDIPTSFPRPLMPVFNLSLLPMMVKSALTLALLGSIDSLLTSLVADNVTRTRHKSDRELIGQGIGNMVAGMFGGLPGAGATMRTVVNVRAGGRTPISGVLHALALLALVLGAGALARDIPHVVLAAILIKVGTDIIDWRFLKGMHKAPGTSVLLMMVVLLITVFVDLITSVAVGMVAASLILVNRMARLQMASITAITDPEDESPLCEQGMEILKEAKGRLLVYHLSGPLSFGAAKDMAYRLALKDGYDVLVLDFSDVPSVDFTTCMAIEDMIKGAQVFERQVIVSGLRPAVRERLRTSGVLDLIGLDRDVSKRLYAMRKAASMLGLKGYEEDLLGGGKHD